MTKLSRVQLLVVLSAALSLGQIACGVEADPIPSEGSDEVATSEDDLTRAEGSAPRGPVVQHGTSDDVDRRANAGGGYQHVDNKPE